ncbi:MAG: hypothetical protein IT428_10735 [Planctomycetaceae bacterium]|nr:hypothetical protein [Planctomycetaceae bacterium]
MPPTPNGPRVAAQDDLYTVLLICATALLLIGTIFIAVRSSMLFDTAFPVAG